jgi:cyclohexadienyl dehydratase
LRARRALPASGADRGQTPIGARLACALLALLLLVASGALAADRTLRVAVTGDYPPLCERSPAGEYVGLDPDVAREFAAQRGYEIAWVAVTWPDLASALAAGRFDVAMTGVTVRLDRSVAGRFVAPIAESGALALVRDPALASEAALARPGVAIAVNAGGHLERVARARFPQAAIRALPDNSAVRDAFASGAAPVVLTDTLEAARWRALATGAAQVGPLTHDVKAYWLPADHAALAAELDVWLLAREADGTLARLRHRHLAPDDADHRTALPTSALVAALAERLALMPAVAEAKRASGAPVQAPAREAELQTAAVASAQEAGRRAGLEVPSRRALERFFAALFESSRAVQSAVLAVPPAEAVRVYDLETELRPALSRITERVATLLPLLPRRIAAGELADALARQTAGLPGMGEPERARIASALAELASARRRH